MEPSRNVHSHPYDLISPPSDWVTRWGEVLAAPGTVLDVACGQGRHCRWFAERGHRVTGIDRDQGALRIASRWATVVCADLEAAPWPFQPTTPSDACVFDLVVVTNYLWRPLIPRILSSVAPGGWLVYETFAIGNEAYGRPHNPDFLLREGELLAICNNWHITAYEHTRLSAPHRVVQRIAARRPHSWSSANT